MFRVKVCGITTVEDALQAVRSGADALGLNFYGRSPRCITPAEGRAIAIATAAEATSSGRSPVRLVGVFVNEPVDRVDRIVREAALTDVQLHGDESPADVAEVAAACPPGIGVLRAIRLGDQRRDDIMRWIAEAAEAGRQPDAVLIDAAHGAAYGGTGQLADWRGAYELHPLPEGVALILAGGLAPDNVADAISAVRPGGVDVASGVETSPGRKNHTLVAAFVAAAHRGFAAL